MTHADQILEFLRPLTGPICDDCLSVRTRITPRQTINQRCRELEQQRRITRERLLCSFCRTWKLSNRIGALAAPPEASSDQSLTTFDPHDRPWHWEGNVQRRLATWLETQGWRIVQTADTSARTSGKDIVAERSGQTLWVSVKGYPNATSKTRPPTQARHWFSHAIFDAVLYRDESATAEIALGLPDGYVTYQNLAARVQWLRTHLPLRIYWVSETGDVREECGAARR